MTDAQKADYAAYAAAWENIWDVRQRKNYQVVRANGGWQVVRR